MHPSKLKPGEFVAILGGAMLGFGLFMDWYATKGLGRIDGARGAFSGWDVHTIIRYPLLAAAIAPLILAYILLRDHALSWPRGELTAVLGIAAFGLIIYNGLVGRPGTSNQLTSLESGWFIAVVGTVLMIGGSALRASSVERKRKPPGTL